MILSLLIDRDKSNDRIIQDTRYLRNIDELDELNPDYIPRYTTRSSSSKTKDKGAKTVLNIDYNNIDSLCNLASVAYLSSLTTGDNSNNNNTTSSKSTKPNLTIDKVIIIKPNKVIKEPKDYNEAKNSPNRIYSKKL